MANFVHAIHSQYSMTLSLIMDSKRARPFQLITQSLHMIETEPEKFNATPITISKYLKKDREVSEGLKSLAVQVYTTLSEMINADVELFQYGHKLSAVEFIFLTYMIAKLPKLPIYQYQNYLLAMKKHVWDKHDEVRFNSKVFNTLKEFVDSMKYEFDSNHRTISHTSSSDHQNILQTSSRYGCVSNRQNILHTSSHLYNSLQSNTNLHDYVEVKME
jgi:hypothetical protein